MTEFFMFLVYASLGAGCITLGIVVLGFILDAIDRYHQQGGWQ